jgi:hypothetical protein
MPAPQSLAESSDPAERWEDDQKKKGAHRLKGGKLKSRRTEPGMFAGIVKLYRPGVEYDLEISKPLFP